MQFSNAVRHTITWKILNTVFLFLINILLVRLLGAELSGSLFYGITILSLVTLAVSFSLESGLSYYVSARPGSSNVLLRLLLPWLAMQAVICWIILRNVKIEINPAAGLGFVMSNLCIIYYSAVLFAGKRIAIANLVPALVNFLLLTILASLWLSKKTDPAISMQAYFGSFMVQAGLLIIFVYAKIPVKRTDERVNQGTLINSLFRYAGIAFASNLLFFLATRIDYYFVDRFTDPIQLSNYVQATRMGQLIILVPATLATVVFPFSASGDGDRYLENVKAACRLITALFAVLAFLVLIFGRWLFPWLLGPSFTGVQGAVLWYLPGFFALSIVSVLAAYLAGRSRLLPNLFASIAALIVVVAGDILLIPRWGINAAAAVSSAAYLLCLVVLALSLKRMGTLKAQELFILRASDLRYLSLKLKSTEP